MTQSNGGSDLDDFIFPVTHESEDEADKRARIAAEQAAAAERARPTGTDASGASSEPAGGPSAPGSSGGPTEEGGAK